MAAPRRHRRAQGIVAVAASLLILATPAQSRAAPRAADALFDVPAGRDLTAARDEVRRAIRTRIATTSDAAASDGAVSGDIHVRLGAGTHRVPPGGLHLDERDSGQRGRFKVVWIGAPTAHSHRDTAAALPANGTVVDGGATIAGFKRAPALGPDVWMAPAPASVGPLTRQLYVDGVRYNRTFSDPVSVGLDVHVPGAAIVDDGYVTPSEVPLQWADPASVEVVADFTWVQHRCAVSAVTHANTTDADGACNWSAKTAGASPGTSIAGPLNVSSYEACQALCCAKAPQCKAIIYHSMGQPTCYLLDRTYEGHYVPQPNAYVANLNGPPAPTAKAHVSVRRPCWDIARKSGYGQLTFPSFVENTGNLSSSPGVFRYDNASGSIVVRAAGGAAQDLSAASAVAAVHDGVLLQLSGAHDIEFHNITFQHSTWMQPTQPSGFVERYGNVRFLDPTKQRLEPMPGAVMVASGARVAFDSCAFVRLGQWGLRLYNGTQDTSVRNCAFTDLSGGGVAIGNVNDTAQTDTALQTARVAVEDNTLFALGREYRGAPGIHSFCMANSSVAHNAIRNVGYTGLSYNWPDPQGPTLGPNAHSSSIGYSANNQLVGNDIADFMGYMIDGGGIHTIGRSYNTTVARNYFHDIGAGRPDRHSPHGQSVIYVDNWSCDLSIDDNVVDDCAATIQGYFFFQSSRLGLAHDNTISGLYLRDAGTLSGRSVPCNCTDVVKVRTGDPWPSTAQAIVDAAGPRT